MDEFMDDIFNFSELEVEEDDERVEGEGEDIRPRKNITRRLTGSRQTKSFGLLNTDDPGLVEEEDLEWISNKDAFPVIETFVGVLPSEDFPLEGEEVTETKQLSLISVLETSSNSNSSTTTTNTTTSNSSGGSNGTLTATTTTIMNCCVGFNFPVKARSKRLRTGRRDLGVLWTGNEQGEGLQKRKVPSTATVMGRKCQHCGAEKTPQWRAGPSGPKTLCNACGVRYKSGRLVPEYRPANSPTFSAELHSNSHRKIVEMRKQFQSGDGDRKDCG